MEIRIALQIILNFLMETRIAKQKIIWCNPKKNDVFLFFSEEQTYNIWLYIKAVIHDGTSIMVWS